MQYTGAFTSAFILAGTLAFVGAVMVALFVKPIKSGVVNVKCNDSVYTDHNIGSKV